MLKRYDVVFLLGSLPAVFSIITPDGRLGDQWQQQLRTPWAERREQGSRCPPGATGQFHYPADCKKFLNCWKGRGTLQVCAPGTLFNPSSLECDHPSKVRCMDADGYQGDEGQVPMPSGYVRFPKERPAIAPNPNSKRPTPQRIVNQHESDEIGGAKGRHRHEHHEHHSHSSQSNAPVQCQPGATGHYPHPYDCRKFLHCWDGRTFVKECGPGTAFNPSISVCDHIHNVRSCGHPPATAREDTDDNVQIIPPEYVRALEKPPGRLPKDDEQDSDSQEDKYDTDTNTYTGKGGKPANRKDVGQVADTDFVDFDDKNPSTGNRAKIPSKKGSEKTPAGKSKDDSESDEENDDRNAGWKTPTKKPSGGNAGSGLIPGKDDQYGQKGNQPPQGNQPPLGPKLRPVVRFDSYGNPVAIEYVPVGGPKFLHPHHHHHQHNQRGMHPGCNQPEHNPNHPNHNPHMLTHHHHHHQPMPGYPNINPNYHYVNPANQTGFPHTLPMNPPFQLDPFMNPNNWNNPYDPYRNRNFTQPDPNFTLRPDPGQPIPPFTPPFQVDPGFNPYYWIDPFRNRNFSQPNPNFSLRPVPTEPYPFVNPDQPVDSTPNQSGRNPAQNDPNHPLHNPDHPLFDPSISDPRYQQSPNLNNADSSKKQQNPSKNSKGYPQNPSTSPNLYPNPLTHSYYPNAPGRSNNPVNDAREQPGRFDPTSRYPPVLNQNTTNNSQGMPIPSQNIPQNPGYPYYAPYNPPVGSKPGFPTTYPSNNSNPYGPEANYNPVAPPSDSQYGPPQPKWPSQWPNPWDQDPNGQNPNQPDNPNQLPQPPSNANPRNNQGSISYPTNDNPYPSNPYFYNQTPFRKNETNPSYPTYPSNPYFQNKTPYNNKTLPNPYGQNPSSLNTNSNPQDPTYPNYPNPAAAYPNNPYFQNKTPYNNKTQPLPNPYGQNPPSPKTSSNPQDPTYPNYPNPAAAYPNNPYFQNKTPYNNKTQPLPNPYGQNPPSPKTSSNPQDPTYPNYPNPAAAYPNNPYFQNKTPSKNNETNPSNPSYNTQPNPYAQNPLDPNTNSNPQYPTNPSLNSNPQPRPVYNPNSPNGQPNSHNGNPNHPAAVYPNNPYFQNSTPNKNNPNPSINPYTPNNPAYPDPFNQQYPNPYNQQNPYQPNSPNPQPQNSTNPQIIPNVNHHRPDYQFPGQDNEEPGQEFIDLSEGESTFYEETPLDKITKGGRKKYQPAKKKPAGYQPDKKSPDDEYEPLINRMLDLNETEPEVKPAPPSGQNVRIRGGSSVLDGYLEVRPVGGRWGLVCDDNWDIEEASIVCRELGFSRGAELSWQGYPMKPGVEALHVSVDKMECVGDGPFEESCRVTYAADSKCQVSKNAVGLRCYNNLASTCQPGELHLENHCYKLSPVTKNGPGLSLFEASERCARKGGHLLDLNTQTENDFISEWLVQSHPNVTEVMTAGVGITVMGLPMWIWQGTEAPMLFEKWWTGWSGERPVPQGKMHQPVCLVMKRKFPCPNKNPEEIEEVDETQDMMKERSITPSCITDYFFWDSTPCQELKPRNMPYICERPISDVGCVEGRGETYSGTANTTASGKPCLSWDHPKVIQGLARREKSDGAKLTKQNYSRADLTGHNFCRNVGKPDRHPWCFVEGSENSEYCDIPHCYATAGTDVNE